MREIHIRKITNVNQLIDYYNDGYNKIVGYASPNTADVANQIATAFNQDLSHPKAHEEFKDGKWRIVINR